MFSHRGDLSLVKKPRPTSVVWGVSLSDTSSGKTNNLIYGIANIKGNVVLKEKTIHNPYMRNSKLDNPKYIEFVIEKVHDFKKSINGEASDQ